MDSIIQYLSQILASMSSSRSDRFAHRNTHIAGIFKYCEKR